MSVAEQDRVVGHEYVASYKGHTLRMRYEIDPVSQQERFVVVDPAEKRGQEFRSLRQLGRAVGDPQYQSGWTMWHVPGEEPQLRALTPEPMGTPAPKATRTRKAKEVPIASISEPVVVVGRPPEVKKVRQIRKARRQDGVPEGKVKMHCSACQRAFLSDNAHPRKCPQGHAAVVEDDLAWDGDALSAKAEAALA